MSSNDNGQVPFQHRLIASCTGAFLTSLSMTPFDVVKSRLQAQNQPEPMGHTYLNGERICDVCGTEAPKPKLRLNGTVDAFVKIGKLEGVPVLWRGITPTLLMSVPGTVTYYSLYDQLRPMFGDNTFAPAVTGSISRMFAATVVAPLELFRTKTQATKGIPSSEVFQTIVASARHEGVGVLFRGLIPTLLRDIPFSAMYWMGYENFSAVLRKQFYPNVTTVSPPITISFFAGALSGMIAATITLPFDVVKTRQQSLLGEMFVPCEQIRNSNVGRQVVSGGNISPIYRESMKTIFQDIYTKFGWRGFFTGFAPRIAKVAPACAIMISTYEFFKQLYRDNTSKEREYDPTVES
eukprot:m.15239 g.15239  ORF g.15239 m.15239 type:complete len:351 (+) comp4443_c0_seq1:107-1159(+)